jgi:hypothetical protein
MNVEILLLLLFVFLTVIAYMIAINSRGIWRLTLSFLLATCMLGGTVWVIILQYSTTAKSAIRAERSRFETEKKELLQTIGQNEHMTNAARMSHLIAQANVFAVMLQRERLQDQDASHERLVGRATNTGERVSALQNEINSYRQVLTKFPEAAKLLEEAMAELKEACRLYRAYYFAENSSAEQAAERQIRQKAKNAQDTLAKAQKLVGNEE